MVAQEPALPALRAVLARRTLTLRETLALAIRVCAQLERASAAGVSRSDLRPETIGWNEVTGEVWLLTLRGPIGDWRAAEREALGERDGLAYISPEMTGRMNREVDHRSALYSLGIILYELLTGELPFDAEDAMGMIHCHIARAPVAPDRRNPAIPPVLSRIVLHLMAKDAEDRYQSAAGLAADLERCLRCLDDGEPIADFEIAACDRKVQLRIPRRLYGREREVELLARSFERAGAIRSELCLVRGPSGVGKSALVGELRQAALERGGLFAEGKFDQLKSDIPYSALRHALRGLVRGLLTRSDDELLDWRRRLLVALENSGQLMVDLVPDLAPVIGAQPAVEKLLPAEAQVQFHAVFERFIGVFAQVEHPLVLFLDDLQWADSSTLGLFQVLLGSPERRGLLLVGSYRDDEVGADHPLQLAVEELARSAPVHDLVVGPLPVESIAQLVRDTLQPGAAANELAVLVHERTGGNPLFAAQLLEALHQAQLLSWSVERGWHWDLRAIAAAATESVLDLMVARLRRLPPATQAATRLGACMGNLFHCEQLAAVMEQPESQVALALDPALASGLLVAGEEDGGEIRFRHDRVQQGAYSLIPEAEREGFHLTIGRLLLAGKESCPRGERLFDVVSHLNRARRLITSPSERRELVELNLAAAERARASVAFRSFLELMKVAAECMPEDAWSSDPDLADRVQLDLAEAHYLNGQHEELGPHVAAVLARTQSTIHVIRAHQILVLVAMGQGKPTEAAGIALELLGKLGIHIPTQVREIDVIREFIACKLRLALYSERRLKQLPEITDDVLLATMEFCMLSLPPVSFGAPAAFPILLMKILRMTLEHGHCFLSPVPFLGFAIILARIGKYEKSRRFTELAWDLQERFGSKKVKVYMTSGWSLFLRWYWERFADVASSMEADYQDAVEVGNLEIMAHELFNSTGLRFLAGEELSQLSMRCEKAFSAIEGLRQWTTLDAARPLVQAVLNLTRGAPELARLRGELFDPETLLPRLEAQGNPLAIFCAATFSAYMDILFGTGERALAETIAAEKLAAVLPVTNFQTLFCFVQSLALVRVHGGAGGRDGGRAYEKKIARNLRQLRRWAAVAPQNLGHKTLLVEAELSSARGKARKAEALYERAARLALASGAVHDAALARELHAEHCIRAGRREEGMEQLVLAHRHYRDWGAAAKVADLEARHPACFPLVAEAPVATAPAGAPSRLLDLASVWKASRALSGEIVLESLLRRLMEVMIENAGAHAGMLLLQREGDWKVEAQVRLGAGAEPEIHVLEGLSVEITGLVPRSLIHYVIRTGESVVLDDPQADASFAGEPYFRAHPVKSALAIPISKQGRVVGVLYLENPLTRGAFTAERVEFLTVLSAQAAISIENAMLVENLERKVEERTDKLRQLQKEAVASAHRAGMADIATDVLHNVGNILSAINVHGESLNQVLWGSRAPGVTRAGQMLSENSHRIERFLVEDPRGKALPGYLIQLGDLIMEENRDAIEELEQLRTKIAQIGDVVAAQQSYATGGFLIEEADLSRVVDDVLAIQAPALERSRITVERSYEPVPPIPVQRAKLAHVLLHILRNAEDAMATSAEGRSLAIHVGPSAGGALIRIRDLGDGIAEENLDRIFSHGFTTRSAAQGFGLHFCANAMSEMGGSITVESDGPGQGATFHLTFRPS